MGVGEPVKRVEKTDAEWRQALTPEQYLVLREGATEAPFTGAYESTEDPGTYRCAGCDAELFRSDAKYHSGSGWPSFWEAASGDAIETREDRSHGMVRIEAVCCRVRRAPRPRLPGRARADRTPLLHQLRRAPPRRRRLTARLH